MHYWVEFPNENIQLTKSGNYIIVVYPEGEEQYPVLTQKFYVTENSMQILPKLSIQPNLMTNIIGKKLTLPCPTTKYRLSIPIRI